MANSLVEIPQDIIDNVIAALGNDKSSLKQCALVSSSFLPPSRKQLFYSISFGFNVEACDRLHQALVQNPLNPSFVRRISINHLEDGGSNLTFDQLVLAILQLPFCHLEELSLSAVDWSGFSGELKDALSTLMHSPTLKILYLTQVDSVPLTLFRGIVHLPKLYLRGVWFHSLKPKGVATTASQTVVDHCVWSFWFATGYPTEGSFLPFMSHLRVLEINIDPSSATMSDFSVLCYLMSSLCASLRSPATLEYVRLNIAFEGNDEPFDYVSFYSGLRCDPVWRNLDSIVTRPTGSRLQRVDIDIRYTFPHDDNIVEPCNDKILAVVLDNLPLLRDRGILFVEAKAR
ncbi:uncharacterized protein LACBIDRAFT_334187 [Laccaria bicolor S238N-H82]|uniref:Predicted protein n=1 Tax=Laccaria bicolor (strain S238N-H82 / ATCC MYA-4686) TaxID=486041 RepID=B0DYD4_LACBS|nr:uncharacterized protein LACBIDRAFT_334187 [Laccaria bicolor S238N-H82]EDR00368.1 predicted protein [Laccaria bicolor S238N-H82]|eukprot:XP_001888927.1 predicted protein [Laccaria bicolor S238N-H82]